jgi:predicted transcriptional regulator
MPQYPKKDTVAMMNPALYVLGQLAKLKRDSLTQLLGFLHFRHVQSLLNYIRWGLDNGMFQELCFRVLNVLTRSLHSQVFIHSDTKRNLEMICSRAGKLLNQQRQMALTNRAALQLMVKELDFLKQQ